MKASGFADWLCETVSQVFAAGKTSHLVFSAPSTEAEVLKLGKNKEIQLEFQGLSHYFSWFWRSVSNHICLVMFIKTFGAV